MYKVIQGSSMIGCSFNIWYFIFFYPYTNMNLFHLSFSCLKYILRTFLLLRHISSIYIASPNVFYVPFANQTYVNKENDFASCKSTSPGFLSDLPSLHPPSPAIVKKNLCFEPPRQFQLTIMM